MVRMQGRTGGFRTIRVAFRVHRGGGRQGVVGGQDAGEDLLQPHDAVGALVAAPPEGERACAQQPDRRQHRSRYHGLVLWGRVGSEQLCAATTCVWYAFDEC